MSRAKRRTRNTSRKRATPRLNDTVHTTTRTESAEGSETAAHGRDTDEGAAPILAELHEGRVPPAEHESAPDHGESATTTVAQDEPAPDRPAADEPAPQPAPALGPLPDGPLPDMSLPDAADRLTSPTLRDTLPRRPARGPAPRPRTMRMRIAEAEPWSVTVMSFLLLGGLGILTVVASVAAWGLAAILAPDALPRLSTFLTITFSVIILEVVLGSCLAALTTFLYNLTAPYNGGLEISLTDDLGPTEAGANAQLAVDRASLRARRYLRAHTPAWLIGAVRRLPAWYVSLWDRAGSLRDRYASRRRGKPAAPSDHAVPVSQDAGQGD
ncbi:DUF3566 domain-containing protein [Streptomyces sp. NPDC007157]|uniref:DUF3566 domain-containing protein n=1 Tax=Streptomyces sp. NPDC007157 TaxID=3154681 RepID=UPI0033CF4EC8